MIHNMKREYKKQILILALAFLLAFTMFPASVFASVKSGYGFDVTASGETLDIEKGNDLSMQGGNFARYYIDATGDSVVINTETFVLTNMGTRENNIEEDGESLKPTFTVSKPGEDEASALSNYKQLMENGKFSEEKYESFSMIQIRNEQTPVGFIFILWEKESNNTYGFSVKDSGGNALTVNQASDLQGLKRYYADANGSQITIDTTSLLLQNVSQQRFNLDDDENYVPLIVTKPTTDESKVLEQYSAYVSDIGVAEEDYDGFSIVFVISAQTKQPTGFILVRWEKDAGIKFELSGGGTENSPYIIETAEHLVQISQNVANGETFAGKYFKIADSVSDEGLTLPDGWVPIGCLKDGVSEYGGQSDSNRLQDVEQTYTFNGIFDGNDKTVNVAENGLPLFGSISGAEIKNLNIYGSKIRGYGLVEYYAVGATGKIDNVTIKSGSHILRSGLLGGYGNTSVDISNCTVESGVVIGDDGTWGDLGDTTYFYDYVGEINHQDCIGSFVGAWNGNITNCVSYATVYGRNNVGGIAGFKGQSMRYFAVSDCAFYGNIVATGSMVGGIVGNGYTAGSGPNTICVTIENCYATGNIKGANNVGGIFGGEGGSAYCWGNGIGRIRNNYFAGKVSATEADANVGGIIGYMNSLDRYNDIRDNYYVEGCGAEKGIGGAGFVVDKTYTPTSSYQHYGRDDDPLGIGSENLAKEITSTEATNGTLLGYLQAGKYGGSWVAGTNGYPTFGSEKHIVGILSRQYNKNQLETNSEHLLSLNGDYTAALKNMKIYVRYSNGTEDTLTASQGEFSGVDFSKEGYQLAKFTYDGYEITFGVRVISSSKSNISVTVSIYGYEPDGSSTVKHSMSADNLSEWIGEKTVSVLSDDTALEAVRAACSSEERTVISVLSEDDENITTVVHDGVTLKNGANGKTGSWIYTLNGKYTSVPLGGQTLAAGDKIVLHYSEDQEADYEKSGKTTTKPDTSSRNKINVTFRLIGGEKAEKDVNLTDSDYLPNYVTWISTTGYSMDKGSTMYDLFTKAIANKGLTAVGAENNYVKSITAPSGYSLGEFDNGQYSGWMYTVNGKHPSVGLQYYTLQAGDVVIWHYVNDYRYEVEDWFDEPGYPSLATDNKYYNGWLKAADTVGASGGGSTAKTEETKTVTTDTTSGSAATTAPTETKVTEKTNADGTKEKTVAVTVSTANQTEIIKQATDKKSAEIVLEVASTQAAGAQNVQLQLNVSFVKNVSEKTDAALTVNTENGTVSLDQNTIKTVLDEAKGTTITLDMNKVANPTEVQKKAAGESGQILSLTVKSGDKTISDFKTGKVTVTVAISTALQNKRVAAIHIAEDGKIEQMPGKSREVGGKKCYEFTTSHFSDFALVDADELGLETEDEIDAAALVAKLTPVARSAKTAKGYIKVQANLDKNDKAIISELQDAGYTVKYRFYRSTKKSASYKSALTKKTTSYTNTSGKKDTKYYYKVQVRVYDEGGKLVAKTALKQCKYACRTWK